MFPSILPNVIFASWLRQIPAPLAIAAIAMPFMVTPGLSRDLVSCALPCRQTPSSQVRQQLLAEATQPTQTTLLPNWMGNKQRNHIYRMRGVYNDDIYNIKPLALDLNAVAVGHALAYEDLVTGKADQLETQTFEQINTVLKNPPRFMPDEAVLSATFGRKYGVLEQVFEWTHIFHAQTVDVLASTRLTPTEKEAEIERLYEFYKSKVPYAITSLPMNMGFLDSQSYSKAFRQKYPKVNGLFWGYHWLQGTMYDTLYTHQTLDAQQQAYTKVAEQYHTRELYRTDRPFMPMFAETSPVFAARFPYIANVFDNLHMLHDLVNDILATERMSDADKQTQVQQAIWMVMAANHEDMEPGKKYSEGLHDHRFMDGIPGMGLMPEGVMHNHGHHPAPAHQPDSHQPAVEDHGQHDHSKPMSPENNPQPGATNHGQQDHSQH